MKKFNYILLFLLCFASLGCEDHQQMLTQLEELERQNLADSLMTNDTLAIALSDYFDSHGTPNERMLAHYLLGRTYADRFGVDCKIIPVEIGDGARRLAL